MADKKNQHIKGHVDTVNDTPLMMIFREYSKILDEKNDKYERIYKTSRDLTNRSKKTIFLLQRIPGLGEEKRCEILTQAGNELRDIEQTLLKHIAMELRDEETYQFVNAYSNGMQEYIEAVTLYNFISTEVLISHTDIQQKLVFGSDDKQQSDVVPLSVLVQPREYILGVADLSGELMRYCIKSVSTGDFEMCYKIGIVLKRMHEGFLSLGYIQSRDLYHKMLVFKTSLNKVEEACYSLQLRKNEIPPEMLGDIFTMIDLEERENSGYDCICHK
ncbi:unnamed protein product, partial [Meganyctiphanes norvegica]